MPASGSSSGSLKFGSYDKFALNDINDFDEFKTVDEKSWAVAADNSKVNDITMTTPTNLAVLIEPQMSMIFLPEDLYDSFKNMVTKIYNSEISCDIPNMPCMFQKTCEKVSSREVEIKISLKDDSITKDVKLTSKQLLSDS